MRLIQIDVDKPIRFEKPIVACIGYFDGLHLGHKELIKKTLELASKYECEPTLITFDPDPWVTIKGLKNVKHLTTMKQRINLASQAGIKNIIILKFLKNMSELSYEEFEEKILLKCNLKGLVCGFDFRYGKSGQGTSDHLKKLRGVEVCVIESINFDNLKISTTRIGNYLTMGKIEEANKLLGYMYEIQGKVIHGNRQGTKIGYPTANLEPEEEYLIPKDGVYSAYIKVNNKWYRSVVNIGHNPTFNYSEKKSIEAYILDFNESIYGANVSLKFAQYIREEKKFNNIYNLILQMDQDVWYVKRNLKEHE